MLGSTRGNVGTNGNLDENGNPTQVYGSLSSPVILGSFTVGSKNITTTKTRDTLLLVAAMRMKAIAPERLEKSACDKASSKPQTSSPPAARVAIKRANTIRYP